LLEWVSNVGLPSAGEGTKLGTGWHPAQIPLSKMLGNSTEISALIDKGLLVPDELVLQVKHSEL
jgi:hypothetical protein